MNNIPEILDNPDNPLFNLIEAEIYLIKEAVDLIHLEKYSYSLFALWNCILSQTQRRIESFGIENFLKILENKNNFHKEAHNIKERWLKINDYDAINYALQLGIITHLAHDLITSLYWMKTNANEKYEKPISKEEIYSLFFLLETNFFKKEFKNDKRDTNYKRRESIRGGRRKEDKEEIITSLDSNNSSTTHQELLLKSGVKMFANNLETNKKNDKLLNAYI